MRKSKMKKAIAAMAIALGLCITTTSNAAFAEPAPVEIFTWDNGTVSTTTVETSNDYLGDVQIGNLWLNDGTPCNYYFSVFIVEDSVKEVTIDTKTSHPYEDVRYWNDEYREFPTQVVDGKVQVGWTLPVEMNSSNSVTFTYKVSNGWFTTPVVESLLYYFNEEYAGYNNYAAIIFTKSELAEFQKSGKLPQIKGEYKKYYDEFVPLLDLTELKNVLAGSGSKSTSTPTPSKTPAPSSTTDGNTSALKTTDSLINTIPANPTKGKDLEYKVQKGEKLFTIAYNYYGSMQKSVIDKIYQANAAYFKSTKGVLKAGAVLTLPAKGLITPVTQSSLDKAAGMYLVKSGDTLGTIAKTYYGDSNQWQKIYEANKDRVKIIGKNPMIYEGQWLVIPE